MKNTELMSKIEGLPHSGKLYHLFFVVFVLLAN